jgi:hypothetical protein
VSRITNKRVITTTNTYKVYTNCANVAVCVRVIRKTQKEARFANTTITNEQELEQIIAATRYKQRERVGHHGGATTRMINKGIKKKTY